MGKENKFSQMAEAKNVQLTMKSLEKNWIHPYFVSSKKEALEKIIDLIPHHDEVMNMTSVTLSEIWLDEILNTKTDYVSVRNLIWKTDGKIMKKRLWTAHDWAIWSVHAVTEKWQLIIASATWSQLPAYAYWATNVIWVVWTQKIVKDLDEWFERIRKYVFPLENERALQAYWVWSWINKLLIVNKEVVPWRIHLIFVNEKLGF